MKRTAFAAKLASAALSAMILALPAGAAPEASAAAAAKATASAPAPKMEAHEAASDEFDPAKN
ncbi:MAG: ammonia channel protein, partial [Sutterellaceae bacterium]|nr:ammonia channel protein [Sutterellaceae bacterium]